MILKTYKATVKAVDDETGIVTLYSSVFGNVDFDEEVIDKGAFKRTLGLRKGKNPVLWQHDRVSPIGWGIDAEEDNYGLLCKYKALTNCEAGRYAMDFIKTGLEVGAKVGVSIGFRVPKNGAYTENGITHYREVDLLEYSIVTFPANELAVVVGAKGAVAFQDLPLADESHAWDASAAEGRVRAWAGGPEKDDINWTKYRRAFLWSDASDPENFASYKLPVADVIGGKLTVVPRGVMAAVGGHGVNSINTPEPDKAKVREAINRYYKKMGKDSPFKSDGGSMPQFKASDFDTSLQNARALDDLYDAKWQISDALNTCCKSICEDATMTRDQKKDAFSESHHQYAEVMGDWWGKYLDLTQPEDEDDEPDDDSEPDEKALKHLSYIGLPVCDGAKWGDIKKDLARAAAAVQGRWKEGRAISRETGARIMKAKGYMLEAKGYSKSAIKAKESAIGVLEDLSQGYAWNDVNAQHPAGGDKPTVAPNSNPVGGKSAEEAAALKSSMDELLAKFRKAS